MTDALQQSIPNEYVPKWGRPIGSRRYWTHERIILGLIQLAKDTEGPLPRRRTSYNELVWRRPEYPSVNAVLREFRTITVAWEAAGVSSRRLPRYHQLYVGDEDKQLDSYVRLNYDLDCELDDVKDDFANHVISASEFALRKDDIRSRRVTIAILSARLRRSPQSVTRRLLMLRRERADMGTQDARDEFKGGIRSLPSGPEWATYCKAYNEEWDHLTEINKPPMGA